MQGFSARRVSHEQDDHHRHGPRGPGPRSLLWQSPFSRAADRRTPQKHAETRIATINLAYVVKHYDKAVQWEKEFKQELARYEGATKKLRSQLEADDRELKDPATQAERKEALESEIRTLKRKLEDHEVTERKRLTQLQQEQIVILYRDVEQQIASLAKSKEIDLVMQYNDEPNPAEKNLAANITRKLTCAGMLPIYMAQSIDVSTEVLAQLNASYQKEKQPPEFPPEK